MNKILADLSAFAKQYMRGRVGAFFTFVFPILLILLFGAIFSNTGTTVVNVPVQDLDASPMSQAFLRAMNNTTVVKVSMIPGGEDMAAYIKAHTLTLAMQIPDNFSAQVIASRLSNGASYVNVTLYGDPSKSVFGMVQSVLYAVADQMNFVIWGARPIVGVDVRPVAAAQFGYMDYFLPGIVGMTVMTTAMFSMTSICGEYRTRRYFKLLATTTLTKAQWLTSKVIWYVISLTLSLILTVAVGMAVWHTHVVIDAVSLAFIAVGALLFTSLGMLFGTVVKDAESGVAIANAIGFPMMFLSGSFWPIEQMPSYLQSVASVLPLTYLNSGLRDTMVYGNLGSAAVDLAVVAVSAVILFVAAAKLLSWKQR